MKDFKVGDTIIIYRVGFLCTTYDEFAIKHKLHKFVSGYDPADEQGCGEDESFKLITPVKGTIVVEHNDHIGIDIGHRHIIASCVRESAYQSDFDIIKMSLLPEDLFSL